VVYLSHTQFGLCDVGFKVKYTDYINRNGLRFVDENGMYYSIRFDEIEKYFKPIEVKENNIKENNMTIEEKAQAYDKAIERAREWYNNPNSSSIGKSYLYAVFPELKQNKDNRIKEDLIQWINEFPDTIWRGHYKKDVVDWLEKQGEKESVNTTMEEKAEIDGAFTNMMLGKKHPKFKPGDKITNGENVYTIQHVDIETYWVEEHDCLEIPIEYQDQWKLVEEKPKWSEEDNKILMHIIQDIEFLLCDEREERFEDERKQSLSWLKSLKKRMEDRYE